MGVNGKGTISLAPFQFAYPKDYKSIADDMQTLVRIPITSSANLAGVDVSGLDFSKPVCLSNIGSKLKQAGPFKKTLQTVGAAIGMMGADFCFQLPGLDTTGKDLIFGLKMSMVAFDQTKVDINNLINLLPKAWNTLTKEISGGVGIKDIITTALNFKPFTDCPKLVCGSYADLSLNSEMKTLITDSWPAKMSVEIDVGQILQSVAALKSVMDGKGHFKLPNMFGSRRRLEDSHSLETPTVMKLAAGEINIGEVDGTGMLRRLSSGNTEATYVLDALGRNLAAPPVDDTFKFNYKTYVLDGSQCALTWKAMPKKISCTLLLQLGKLKLSIYPEFELSYDLNGIDLVVSIPQNFLVLLLLLFFFKSKQNTLIY